ncbi:MAG: enoyl-CoA hydratase/isomerase family protein [Thermoleophilaceae bacterium]|nr:enoyl-CoA hydratase/isomerase family protein [Thermoleophilaceae bacterium]
MPVHYDVDGAVATLVIDRPERRNAIDGPTADALQRHFEAFAADDDVVVLVLSGAGDEAFCAGADLKAFESLSHRAGAAEGFEGFTRVASPKPTIAAVSGWCVAGGLELALWADIRIATSTARFGVLTRRHGLPFIDGGTQRLPRVVGLPRALDLLMTGREIGAEEAERIALVNEVVEPGRHMERALEVAELIAGHPRHALLADRRAAIEGFGLPIDQASPSRPACTTSR